MLQTSGLSFAFVVYFWGGGGGMMTEVWQVAVLGGVGRGKSPFPNRAYRNQDLQCIGIRQNTNRVHCD